MKKIEETSIANDVMKIITERNAFCWEISFSMDALKTLFEGIAVYLGRTKQKKKITGVILQTVDGVFVMGAYAQFIPNQEDETKGSYQLIYTFDQNDMTPEMSTVNFSDPVLRHIIADVAHRKFNMCFHTYEGHEFIIPIMCACAEAVREYMRANVNIDPTLEMTDYFTANAELDGQAVYVSITPSEVLKQHVKDDASVEQQV